MREENGYFLWTKGMDAPLSTHFHATEFECHCKYPECVEQRISVSLIHRLESVRFETFQPLIITSGYRCAAYQTHLRLLGFETAPGISEHELGNAADVKPKDMATFTPVAEKHFKAIGLALTWAHVDTRDDKPRNWTYQRG